MYNKTLHRDRKHCPYSLQYFSTTQIYVHDFFEINGKKIIKMDKKGETVKFENYTRK